MARPSPATLDYQTPTRPRRQRRWVIPAAVLIGASIVILHSSARMQIPIPAPGGVTTRPSTQPISETQKIERLIQYVASLDGAVFIRNGANYTPAEAAQHMRTKWQAAKGQITTAKQFIELAASRSSLSGREYRVKLKDGTEVSSAALLNQELERMNALRHGW